MPFVYDAILGLTIRSSDPTLIFPKERRKDLLQCPFCIEEIPDTAVVCRVCRRDLQLFISMRKQITDLNAQITQFTSLSDLSHLQNSVIPESPEPRSKITKRECLRIILVLVICYIAVILLGAYADDSTMFLSTSVILFGIILILPVRLGTKINIRWFHALLIAVGLCVVTNLSFDFGQYLHYGVTLFDIDLTLFIAVPTVLMFLSLFWLVRSLVIRRTPQRSLRDESNKSLFPREKNSGDQVDSKARLQHVTLLMGAFAPILAFLASVISALLGYLAAASAHPK